MTNEEREQISKLAGLWHDARARFNALQLSNTPFDYDDARKQTIATEIARAEMWEAERNLSAASIWRVTVGDTASAIVTEGQDPQGLGERKARVERGGEAETPNILPWDIMTPVAWSSTP